MNNDYFTLSILILLGQIQMLTQTKTAFSLELLFKYEFFMKYVKQTYNTWWL